MKFGTDTLKDPVLTPEWAQGTQQVIMEGRHRASFERADVFKAGMLLQENGGCQGAFFVEQFSSVVPLVIK